MTKFLQNSAKITTVYKITKKRNGIEFLTKI